MDPVAILITKNNCIEYAVELNYAYPQPNGYTPSYWIGYYLVITEAGPEILSPVAFAMEWKFIHDPSKPVPIEKV